ncbi:unnamed protein product [Rotaria sp. Silwood1]|nr:unnamed protein product [Rotaria sp. Silwood1]
MLDSRGSYQPDNNRFNRRYNNADYSPHLSPGSSDELRRSISLGAQQREQSNLEPTEEEGKFCVCAVFKVIFLEKPWKYDETRPDIKPIPMKDLYGDYEYWRVDHVCMPYSKYYENNDRQPMWPTIVNHLTSLYKKCGNRTVKFQNLKDTFEGIHQKTFDLKCLEHLITKVSIVLILFVALLHYYLQTYNKEQSTRFMHETLPKICELVLDLKSICPQALPLLKTRINRSFTLSQEQAAALLACAFFCLFPYRSRLSPVKEYENFPTPNFGKLYRAGPANKVEKLKCLLHYFNRVTKKMPNGVITFQRVSLYYSQYPKWNEMDTDLCDLNMTTGRKIEEIKNVLQVDFANKYIGGGVLGHGCVQEEIRFTICPEMIVSLLVCEAMEKNECIFLIGCEQYSKYKGYGDSFKYDGDFRDNTPRDSWGRRWCHVVAIDAIYFREPSEQYHMTLVERELLKAYTGFRPIGQGLEYEFGIATGNWGCGAFHGDRQLKGID